MPARSLPKTLDDPPDPDPDTRASHGEGVPARTALHLHDPHGSFELTRCGRSWSGYRNLMVAIATVPPTDDDDPTAA